MAGRAALAAVAAALVLVGGAQSRSHAVSGSWVGTVSGTNAFVAVVVSKQNQGVLAYVCDSKRIASWFHGRASGSSFTLRSKQGGTLSVRLSGLTATGSFDGHAFTARLARKPAGLYRADRTVAGTRFLGGWIVLPDRRERGAIRTGTSTLTSSFIDPIGTLDVSVGGVTLTAGFITPIGGL